MSEPAFKIDSKGWITPAVHRQSANFNLRPEGVEPELLVIHNISLPPGRFGGGFVEQFFCNELDSCLHPYFEEIADLKVSAHLFISREGRVVQFVSLLDRAWHAGESCFQGRPNCNDFSIGIELEGTDDLAYTDEQYQALARITRLIQQRFPGITESRIAGHCDIAPQRKTDPGPAFDWQHFRQLLVQV